MSTVLEQSEHTQRVIFLDKIRYIMVLGSSFFTPPVHMP